MEMSLSRILFLLREGGGKGESCQGSRRSVPSESRIRSVLFLPWHIDMREIVERLIVNLHGSVELTPSVK